MAAITFRSFSLKSLRFAFSYSNSETVYYNIQSELTLNISNEIEGSQHYGEAIVILNLKKERYKTCLNNEYQYHGVSQDVIGFRNVTNRTISFEYIIAQSLQDESLAKYQNDIKS